MRYLVTTEYIETGALLPSQRAGRLMEVVIVPSLERFVQLETEGKILAGGSIVGARGAVFIVEADSHEEVSRLIQDSPDWGVTKAHVTPLETFSQRAAGQKAYMGRLQGTKD